MRVLCAGSFVCDLIASGLHHIPAAGEVLHAPSGIELTAGGHAANVAIDLAQLGQKEVAAVGCVGRDLFGDFLDDELRRHGIRVYAERHPEATTAKNIALIVEGEDRRFIAELTANSLLSTSHLMSALKEEMPRVFFLGTVGALKHINRDLVRVLEAAQGLGCLTLVDVIMPHNSGWAQLSAAMPLIDVLHCNEVESYSMTGFSNPGEAAKALVKRGAQVVVLSRGAEGVIVATRTLNLEMPGFRVSAVDPTGAGDALCAGFISSLINDGVSKDGLLSLNRNELKRTLLKAQAAGAACVTAVGATTSVTEERVDELIRKQGDSILSGTRVL